jgi:hypothetical protein
MRNTMKLDKMRETIISRHKRSDHLDLVVDMKHIDFRSTRMMGRKVYADKLITRPCDCSPERMYWIVEGRVNGIQHLILDP